MLSALLDTVLGSALQLLLLVIGLLPTIDVTSLPIAPPEPVVDAWPRSTGSCLSAT